MRANASPELDPLENFASPPTRCIVCPLDAYISAEAYHATRCPHFLFILDYFSLRSTIDRKSTRLNSSHQIISYAVFCLKKKKTAIHCSELLRKQSNFCSQKKRLTAWH